MVALPFTGPDDVATQIGAKAFEEIETEQSPNGVLKVAAGLVIGKPLDLLAVKKEESRDARRHHVIKKSLGQRTREVGLLLARPREA